MFSSSVESVKSPSVTTSTSSTAAEEPQKFSKISSLYSYGTLNDVKTQETKQEDIDKFLDQEKLQNKTESWNKLNKTTKIQKLHVYSEKYGKEQGYSAKEIKSLKLFFSESLDRGKLQKTKDVVYDKNIHEIVEVPGLTYHASNRHFTLRVMDTKRISTLKSLTPKRITEKNKAVLTSENNEEIATEQSQP